MTLNLRRNILQLAGTATIGLVAGLAAVVFHEAMILIAKALVEAPSGWPLGRFCGVRPGGHGSGRMDHGLADGAFRARRSGQRHSSGEGGLSSRNSSSFSWHLIWVKFLGGALSIGSGSSLGRRGRRSISARRSRARSERCSEKIPGAGERGLRGFGGRACRRPLAVRLPV